MNGLALCAGIGGLEIGLKRAVTNYRTVCYVERNPYAAGVLAARMEEEALCKAPIWDDLSTFDGKPWRGVIDCISAGFPCQPVSLAGRRRGKLDERWIWNHISRIIAEVDPSVIFLENVPGILSLGGWTVVEDLARHGFDARWGLFSASEVGANHIRRRWFLLAYAPDDWPRWREQFEKSSEGTRHVADAQECRWGQRGPDPGRGGERTPSSGQRGRSPDGGWWSIEPDVGGIAHGISRRLDGVIADEKDERIGEVLRYLQQDHVAQALQWATRRLDCVRATEVLLSVLREYEAGGRLRWALLESEATPETILRKMREQKSPLCPPLRRGTLEQYFQEYPNALRIVSRLVASRGETPWSNPLWEGSVPRVAEKVPSRVDRLKCLGNAVVPAQAELAWRILTS